MLRGYTILFWDFDGVIKDSVTVKSDAYERLFMPFGAALAARVRVHHERNGGMSRFEKLPLYLKWAGQGGSGEEVAAYCERFSAAVRQAVVESAWVPGAREYLEANHSRQKFVIVTGTPRTEMTDILQDLGIAHYFHEVHGAPTEKAAAISSVLARSRCRSEDAILIGDSRSDHVAAKLTGVNFLLRRTPLNMTLRRLHHGPQCDDLCGY